jgi:hypothetical protein
MNCVCELFFPHFFSISVTCLYFLFSSVYFQYLVGELKFDFLNLKDFFRSLIILLFFFVLFTIVLPFAFPTTIIVHCFYGDTYGGNNNGIIFSILSLFSFVPSLIYYFYQNPFSLRSFLIVFFLLLLSTFLFFFLLISLKIMSFLRSSGFSDLIRVCA